MFGKLNNMQSKLKTEDADFKEFFLIYCKNNTFLPMKFIFSFYTALLTIKYVVYITYYHLTNIVTTECYYAWLIWTLIFDQSFCNVSCVTHRHTYEIRVNHIIKSSYLIWNILISLLESWKFTKSKGHFYGNWYTNIICSGAFATFQVFNGDNCTWQTHNIYSVPFRKLFICHCSIFSCSFHI